jgi:GNAT superfamily N-acetyltransferase/acyl carrier protein
LDAEELRHELRAFLDSCDVPGATAIGNDTSLLASGQLDSLALFNLVAWIEARTGRAVDPGTVSLPGDWDSIDNIVRYIQNAASAEASVSAPLPAGPPPSGPGAIEVVRYRPEHARQVADLQSRLWSPDTALNLQYLHWKYAENACGDGTNIYLAFDRQDLVGMRGFYPSRWECHAGNGQFDVLVADDLVLRSDYRKQGILALLMRTALADLAARGHEYVFNLSGGTLTVLGSLAMGWRSARQFEPASRLSWRRALGTAVGNRMARLPYFWRHAENLLSPGDTKRSPFSRLDAAAGSTRAKGEVQVSISATPKPREMADLISRLPYDGRIRHVRDEPFLAWRFCNPLHDYRFLFSGGQALDGYLVLQRSRVQPAVHRVSIVDLEARDDRTRRLLVDGAMRLGRFSELAAWLNTLDPGITRYLKARGFRPADPELTRHGCPCVLVRATDDARPPDTWTILGMDLLNAANWDLRKIYTMAG